MRILHGGTPLRLRSRQAETLLATLALSPDQIFSREDLAERLWPDASPEIRRGRLKQEVSVLRRTLAFSTDRTADLIITTPRGICLAASQATTDVAHFQTWIRTAETFRTPPDRIHALEQAILTVRGPLLPGNYDSHLLQARERLAAMHGAALHLLACLYGYEGEMIRALQAARAAVQNDPLQEQTRLTLIRLSLRSGFPGDAQAQVDDFRELQEQELGEMPSAALLALAQQTQRFATTDLAVALLLRRLSPSLHRLLNTLAGGEKEGSVATEQADPSQLENIAQLQELGLLLSEPDGSVMTYHVLPVLKELLQTSL